MSAARASRIEYRGGPLGGTVEDVVGKLEPQVAIPAGAHHAEGSYVLTEDGTTYGWHIAEPVVTQAEVPAQVRPKTDRSSNTQ